MRLPPLDPAPLDPAEVARRLPVWVALADLFLDTDTALSVPHIARTVVAGGFDLDEVEAWLRWEVRPAFCANLLAVAGEWAGWPEELVRERVLRARPACSKQSLRRPIKLLATSEPRNRAAEMLGRRHLPVEPSG